MILGLAREIPPGAACPATGMARWAAAVAIAPQLPRGRPKWVPGRPGRALRGARRGAGRRPRPHVRRGGRRGSRPEKSRGGRGLLPALHVCCGAATGLLQDHHATVDGRTRRVVDTREVHATSHLAAGIATTVPEDRVLLATRVGLVGERADQTAGHVVQTDADATRGRDAETERSRCRHA